MVLCQQWGHVFPNIHIVSGLSVCLSVCLPVCLSVCTFICVFLSYSFKLSLDGTNTYHGTVKGHSQIFDGYKMTVRSQTEVKVQNSNVVLGNTVLHLLFSLVIIKFYIYFALVDPEWGRAAHWSLWKLSGFLACLTHVWQRKVI